MALLTSTRRSGFRSVGWLAAATAAVVLATACGADDTAVDVAPSEAAETDAPEATPEPSESPSEAEDDAGDDSDEPERLADYLGGIAFVFDADPEEAQAFYARQAQRAEELIAQCMANEGFEYIPAVRPMPDTAFGAPDDVEYAREYGFGVSTTYLDGFGGWVVGGDDDWTDPNQAIVEAMSDSEQQAYFEALHSPPSATGTETDPETGETFEVYDVGFGGGCSAEAYEEVYGGEEYMEILDALDLESMWERIQADPRARVIFGDWSKCMADRGYDFDDPDELYEWVYEEFWARLEEVVGSFGGFVDPFEGLSPEEIDELMSNLSSDEIEDLYTAAQLEARQEIDQEALSALQEEERALAVANAECSQGMMREMEELSKEYEASLIEANRDLLEDYRERRGG